MLRFLLDSLRARLLVTDVVMPRIGGCELANRLADTRPEMKVLFISGYAEKNVFDEILPTGKVDFLQKPFAPEILMLKVRELLDAT